MSIKEDRKPVNFKFRDLENVKPAIYRCLSHQVVWEKVTELESKHTVALDRLAETFNVRKLEKENCFQMATGCRRLLVLLKEPSNHESRMAIPDFLAQESDNTLKFVQKALDFIFLSRRNIFNTAIMDIKPFCPEIKYRQISHATKEKDQQKAISTFLESLSILQPEVILICHCDRDAVNTGLPPELCSDFLKAGETKKWKTCPDGPDVTLVYCFHPGVIYREHENERKRIAKEYLFYTCFMIAANALAGLNVGGDGIEKLRGIAIHGREDQASLNPEDELSGLMEQCSEALEMFILALGDLVDNPNRLEIEV